LIAKLIIVLLISISRSGPLAFEAIIKVSPPIEIPVEVSDRSAPIINWFMR